MDGTTLGLIGGIGGSVLGIAGGVFGTWCSLRSAQSPVERAHILRWSFICWAFCVLFLAGLFLTPQPYNWFWWIPYPFALTWVLRKCNQGLFHIRILEGKLPIS